MPPCVHSIFKLFQLLARGRVLCFPVWVMPRETLQRLQSEKSDSSLSSGWNPSGTNEKP